MIIGINTASSQSGRAYCADFISRGYTIQGFAHNSITGKQFVDAVDNFGGLFLDRPQNTNHEQKRFINLNSSRINHNLEELVDHSDIIILAEPSHYFVDSVCEMIDYGLKDKKIPIILSPSRTCSSIYLWKVLGDMYPLVCLSTCPYSCKAPRPDTAYIKRRKRNFVVSLEGSFTISQIAKLGELFPQAVFNKLPATTSVGNMGAVLHPATYLLNYEEIKRAEKEHRVFSFYLDGIASRPEVGEKLNKIDQMRLQIADKLELKVYGLERNNETEWVDIMNEIRFLESRTSDTEKLRKIRRDGLYELNRSITSIFHWLDYTYGVERITEESVSDAIKRTPTYKINSIPQKRYIDEDIATGLLPLCKLAERFNIDHSAADEIICLADKKYPEREKSKDRTLEEFSTDYLISYLKGEFFSILE